MARVALRPLLRPLRIAAAIAVLLLLWIAREFWIAWTATPGPPIDYAARLHEAVLAHQPADGEDGWPHLQRAADLITRIGNDLRPGDGAPRESAIYLDFDSLTQPDHDDRTQGRERADLLRAKARHALARFESEGGFQELDALARAPRAVRPRGAGTRLMPPMNPASGTAARQLIRASVARMWEAHRVNDRSRIGEAFEQALAVSNAVWHQGTLIDSMVGGAMYTVAMHHMQLIAMERTLPADGLRGCLAVLDRHPAPRPELLFEGMRLESLDAIQQVFTDDGRGGGRLIPQKVRPWLVLNKTHPINRLPDSPLSNAAGFYFEGRRATTRSAERYHEGLTRLAAIPPHQRGPGTFDDAAFLQGLSSRQPLLAVILPLYSTQIAIRDRHDTDVAGLRSLLAIEAYRMEHRSYPDRLEQVSPSILPALPIDPFSGRPFCYRRLPGGDAEGRYYLLWSTGSDATDDGGRSHPELNQRAMNTQRVRTWSPPGLPEKPFVPGYDYIINEPRARD